MTLLHLVLCSIVAALQQFVLRTLGYEEEEDNNFYLQKARSPRGSLITQRSAVIIKFGRCLFLSGHIVSHRYSLS